MIISAAQALQQKQKPMIGGFQPPCMGQICTFDMNFARILHDGREHVNSGV